MGQEGFFELNAWGLITPRARTYAQAAFTHDAALIKSMGRPSSWPSTVDPVHLFACGPTRPGAMDASRHALDVLLDQGADLNASDASGWVPLSYAAWFGLAGCLDVLLQAGAQVHPSGSSPPLSHALSSFALTSSAKKSRPGTMTCVRLLLMSHADPIRCSINESHGRSSFLSWALSVNNLELASLLWSKGDRIRNNKELSILIWQAPSASLDWLIQHDYDVLANLPPDHPHHEVLFQAQASRRRSALASLAQKSRASAEEFPAQAQEDLEEEGQGRRKM